MFEKCMTVVSDMLEMHRCLAIWTLYCLKPHSLSDPRCEIIWLCRMECLKLVNALQSERAMIRKCMTVASDILKNDRSLAIWNLNWQKPHHLSNRWYASVWLSHLIWLKMTEALQSERPMLEKCMTVVSDMLETRRCLAVWNLDCLKPHSLSDRWYESIWLSRMECLKLVNAPQSERSALQKCMTVASGREMKAGGRKKK